ncbi:MAG: polyamine aminopropyltransferase [Pseudodesulfovibrio sp.]
MSNRRSLSLVLKVSIFATGLAGIVAEYVLSTLATYLLGNAIFQWTIVMSLMLFAMGVGSRLSKFFNRRLLDLFIYVEFALSILCASASIVSYGLAAYTSYINLVIYGLAILIGLLIGFEIPLVTRINQDYEELRTNIAMIMEKDYYGALVGGLLFAFVALPYFGLTYTPIALGVINFLVAIVFLSTFIHLLDSKKIALAACGGCAVVLVLIGVFAKPIILFGEQSQYKDKVIYSEQTQYQKIIMTQWKEYHWLFINGQEQFSSFDEEKYHEPLVHPAMKLAAEHTNVLILGGGDGLALREILRHEGVKKVTMVDLDPAMTTLAKTHPILKRLNQGSMMDPRLKLEHMDAGKFLRECDDFFSVIIIDLPDPDTVDLMHLYSLDFYRLVAKRLRAGGVVVTQATSPYFSPLAFLCIDKTMREAGLNTLPYHNQVPTMGEWGWIMGMKAERMTRPAMKKRLEAAQFDGLQTRFLNDEAMRAMLLFGKGIFDHPEADSVEVNTRHEPVLMRYYADGKWAMY